MGLVDFVRIANNEVDNGPAKYTSWYGLPGANWCAIFTSWCAASAGIMTTNSPAECPDILKTASVSDLREFYEESGRFFDLRTEYPEGGSPKVGDIAFFLDNRSHVGIVAGVSGTSVTLIEGNATTSNGSNGVARRTYDNFGWNSAWKITHIGINSARS